ncbi:MAG: dihydroorotate dehydrogenase electron transfer subunit [Bacteroidales bacterium]|nr:dihydroorotate dehydrogenase electron transfer subunit [Bacteroidales bacterium]
MKEIQDFTILSSAFVNREHFLMKVQLSKPLLPVFAGQFVEIKVADEPDVFLRRPISVHDVDYNDNTISFLIRVCGKGTDKLSRLRPEESVNIVYPLGKGFTVEQGKYLLVGGGCGLAPLYYLARQLNEVGVFPDILFGVRNAEALLDMEKYQDVGNVYVTTEDGSVGERGFATQHSILNHPENYTHICTCGPEAMMKAVAQYAARHHIRCEVSLENTMACGIGACLCCVTETVDGHNLCVCTEGPVFDAATLKFSKM